MKLTQQLVGRSTAVVHAQIEIDRDGDPSRHDASDVLDVAFESVDRVRAPASWKHKWNYEGLYWAATIESHVWSESLHERAAMVRLDRYRDVVGIAAQPMWIHWVHGGKHAPDYYNLFLIAYPEIVRLTTVLTDLSFASYLLTPRFQLAQQVWALEAAVITIMHSSTTDHPHQVAERIVSQEKAAVETAYGMRQSETNKRPAALEKALVASSQRHRSCLLRHLSTVRIQMQRYVPGVAAPPNRVLDRRRPLPDALLHRRTR